MPEPNPDVVFQKIFENKLSRSEPNVKAICEREGYDYAYTMQTLVDMGYCFEMFPGKPCVRQWQREGGHNKR